jgi:hypothetical protein
VQGHLALEPDPRPSGGPLVLNSWSQPRPTTPPHMDVDNAKLLKSLKITNNNILRLIMQLVTLSESVTAGFTAEAHHSPKFFRQLSGGIRS